MNYKRFTLDSMLDTALDYLLVVAVHVARSQTLHYLGPAVASQSTYVSTVGRHRQANCVFLDVL